ncbi:MAG: 4-hydroxy-tetrahydrodipicolinate synthase [Deltaproteobacteria bacterium]|nr:4-hydroxy-tetrahydrodipicolinate synthase [Deltaproteobacteria bacterium]
MFTGAITALVTPMRGGNVDLSALRAFVDFQIEAGIDAVVPCGTTGESATLTDEEQAQVIRTVVEQTRKRVPVIAGAGANSTAKAVQLSKMAAEAGADGLLHVTPYYNKPNQAGLVAHYSALAAAVKLPIVVYNVPGRTGCDLLPETMAQLAKLPGIVAIKEATGLLARGQQVVAACGEKVSVLSGDDATCLGLTLLGGHGVISVVSNVIPGPMAKMIAAARKGALDEARRIHYQYQNLMDLMFVESNPIPVKAGVAALGFGQNELRLPLVPLGGEKLERLTAELRRLGVLS